MYRVNREKGLFKSKIMQKQSRKRTNILEDAQGN